MQSVLRAKEWKDQAWVHRHPPTRERHSERTHAAEPGGALLLGGWRRASHLPWGRGASFVAEVVRRDEEFCRHLRP